MISDVEATVWAKSDALVSGGGGGGFGSLAVLCPQGQCPLCFLNGNQPPDWLCSPLPSVSGVERWTLWRSKCVGINRTESIDSLPRLTWCLQGLWDLQSMHGFILYFILFIPNTRKSVCFQYNSFPREGWGNVASGIFLTTLGSRTRAQIFCVVVGGHGCFSSSEDRVPPVLLHSSRSCRGQKQNSCLKWMGSIEILKHKWHRRELGSILNVIWALPVWEGLIYTSNNIFVHFVFREEMLNGDSSRGKCVSE